MQQRELQHPQLRWQLLVRHMATWDDLHLRSMRHNLQPRLVESCGCSIPIPSLHLQGHNLIDWPLSRSNLSRSASSHLCHLAISMILHNWSSMLQGESRPCCTLCFSWLDMPWYDHLDPSISYRCSVWEVSTARVSWCMLSSGMRIR